MPSSIGIKLAALLAIVVGSFGTGWKVHAWRTDSANLKALEALRAEDKESQRILRESTQAAVDALQRSRISARSIANEISKLPHPERECLDPRGVQLLNAAAQGLPASASPEMSRDPTPAH